MKLFLVPCYSREEFAVKLPQIITISAVYVEEICFRRGAIKITDTGCNCSKDIMPYLDVMSIIPTLLSYSAILLASVAKVFCQAKAVEGGDTPSYSNSQISYVFQATLVTFVALIGTAFLFRMHNEGIWTLNCSKFFW